jgi:hypothetical protein
LSTHGFPFSHMQVRRSIPNSIPTRRMGTRDFFVPHFSFFSLFLFSTATICGGLANMGGFGDLKFEI